MTRYWLPLVGVQAEPARGPQSSRRRWSVFTACVDEPYLQHMHPFTAVAAGGVLSDAITCPDQPNCGEQAAADHLQSASAD